MDHAQPIVVERALSPPRGAIRSIQVKSRENRVLWFINVILACEVRGFEWSFGYVWLFRADRRTVYRLEEIGAPGALTPTYPRRPYNSAESLLSAYNSLATKVGSQRLLLN
jgi:hypothetical protein